MNRWRSTPGFAWAERPSISPSRARPTSCKRSCGACAEEGIQIRLLAGGSNVLVRDEGVPGMVVSLADPAFAEITTSGRKIAAGGGAKLGHLISVAVREGLAGLEPLVGIPGSVGGALHGNAGSRGGDIGQWTCRATVMTRSGEIIERERDDLTFAYRESSLDELVILQGQFELEKEDPEELTKRMQKYWIVKKANQPLGHQSAGCIFKNPARHERRHVDRSGGLERQPRGGRRSERPARQFHRGRCLGH